ncbi:hypothetical protein PYCC9005_005699 [Savitreella phatthalungensis]
MKLTPTKATRGVSKTNNAPLKIILSDGRSDTYIGFDAHTGNRRATRLNAFFLYMEELRCDPARAATYAAILAEFPDCKVTEALARSWRRMSGEEQKAYHIKSDIAKFSSSIPTQGNRTLQRHSRAPMFKPPTELRTARKRMPDLVHEGPCPVYAPQIDYYSPAIYARAVQPEIATAIGCTTGIASNSAIPAWLAYSMSPSLDYTTIELSPPILASSMQTWQETEDFA